VFVVLIVFYVFYLVELYVLLFVGSLSVLMADSLARGLLIEMDRPDHC
jgi:hypothetical protein